MESVFQHRMMSPPKSYRTWWLPSHISARLVEKKKQDQLDQILQQNLWPLDALVALAGGAKQLNNLETQVQIPEDLIPFLSCSTDRQWIHVPLYTGHVLKCVSPWFLWTLNIRPVWWLHQFPHDEGKTHHHTVSCCWIQIKNSTEFTCKRC